MKKAAFLLMLVLPLAAQAQSTRDPFMPSDFQSGGLEMSQADFSHWRVDGFIFNQDSNRVLINNRALMIGDVIEGWQIIKLNTDDLTMTIRRDNGGRQTHTLSIGHLGAYR